MRASTLALGIVCLAAGCVQSTWTWTLTPEGRGKVEIDALLQPSFWELSQQKEKGGIDPDAIARNVARKVVSKSKGVAAWRDVSHGIADDGRVEFRGTAYFDNLGKVKIEGEPFPSSILKPSVSRDADGMIVIGLQGDGDGSSEPKASSDTTTRDKMKYQAMRPMLAAVLHTLKSELVIEPPGEVVELSGFNLAEDGRLHFVFDGRKALDAFDQIPHIDQARFLDAAGKIKSAEDREGAFFVALARGDLLGEFKPLRAVVRPAAEPAFDYDGELAAARDGFDELRAELKQGPGATGASTYRSGAGYSSWTVSAGPVAAARTDIGSGTGWATSIGIYDGDFIQLDVSHIDYEKNAVRREMTRVVFSCGVFPQRVRFGVGLGLSFGDGDIWAMGPQVTCGVGYAGERAEIHLSVAGYLWIGERDDAFDVDLEGDARLVVGVRF